MATTEHFYTGNNSTTSYAFTFPYLANSDVKVELDNVLKTENSSGQTDNDYTINNTNIVFNTAPGSGVSVHIFRSTDVDTAQATYAAGSSIRAVDLNNNQTQVLYSSQESGQLIRQSDLKDSIVNSAKIVDGSIVNADVNASAAIAGTKVSPNFGSQNIVTTGTGATGNLGVTGNITVSGTVDGRDVASDGTKLDGIETAATADQTAAEIRTLVESASDSNVFTDADHTKLNGIETGATADQTNAEIRAAVEAASDSNVFTDADHTKLNGIETGATADQTISEIKTLIAGSPLDASHLAANSVTTSEIADAELTTLAGMQSGTASKLADSTALTADIADINQIDGMAKETTITNDDTKFPTSGAVVDYVAAQIAPLGGLEVISNEVSFPNTQPAAGVVISISDAGGTVFNGSGVSTTGRTVGGSTVTINGAPSSLNNETLVAGVGLMVSSTGSSQTYNYHKILGKEDDIKQLSDDINDFNARYRVGSSNPTSNNDAGDLFFNTSTQKLLVYNSTNSAWEEAQSIGNFFISTFSESFDGSRTAFTVSNAPSNAQQLIISINGVIQKPNSGTGQPSEGFTLSGSTVTFSAAIPSGSDYFVIVLGSSVNIGTPSNNTVTSAILQNGSVIEAKIADSAITNAKVNASAAIAGSKIDPSFTSNITITNNEPKLIFADGDQNPDYEIKVNGGALSFIDTTNNAQKFYITSSAVGVNGNLDVGSGLDVTGNITVTGTVDGVDIAALNTTVGNITTDLVNDTSPQLGGNLDLNSNNITGSGIINIDGGTSDSPIRSITSNDYVGKFESSDAHARLIIEDSGSNANANGVQVVGNTIMLKCNNETGVECVGDQETALYYNGNKKLETTNTGTTVTGTLTATSFAGDGSALTGLGGGVPSGCILMWSGAANAIPTGYVLCDGNNSTPNLEGRFVVGAAASGSYAVGNTGGAETVSLTEAQMPAHNHHVYLATDSGTPYGSIYASGNNNAQGAVATTTRGSGNAHENRPPYYALCYIMKT